MYKPLIGLMLLAAVMSASAQNRNRGSHPAPQHSAPQHSAPQRSAPQRSTPQRSQSSGHHTGSGHSHTGTHTGHHTGAHHRRSGTHGSMHQSGPVNLRPSGTGHPRDWFEHQRWHEGPAWQTPSYSCYPGFLWSAQPSVVVTVWMFDQASGQYYQAYYYPQYGYYAWVNNPLVAVGEYSASIAIVVDL